MKKNFGYSYTPRVVMTMNNNFDFSFLFFFFINVFKLTGFVHLSLNCNMVDNVLTVTANR